MTGRTQPPVRVDGLRIVVVEDHEDSREMLAELLRHIGRVFVVALAATAQDGLQRLRGERFDLIVTDVGLPDASGIDMLDQAKVKGSYRKRQLSSS